MPAESSSAAASTGIQGPGGSIYKNSPGVIVFGIVAVVLLFGLWLWWKKKN